MKAVKVFVFVISQPIFSKVKRTESTTVMKYFIYQKFYDLNPETDEIIIIHLHKFTFENLHIFALLIFIPKNANQKNEYF